MCCEVLVFYLYYQEVHISWRSLLLWSSQTLSFDAELSSDTSHIAVMVIQVSWKLAETRPAPAPAGKVMYKFVEDKED